MDNKPYQETMSLEPPRIVHLINQDGTSMPVEVVVEVEIENNLYTLMTPAHPVIDILKEDIRDEEAPFEQVAPENFANIAKNITMTITFFVLNFCHNSTEGATNTK